MEIGKALIVAVATVVGVFALQAWCVGWIFAPVWLVNQIPGDGYLKRAALLLAAGGGLWFSLWLLAKATRSGM